MKLFIYLKNPIKTFDMQAYIHEMVLKQFPTLEVESFERFSDLVERIHEPNIIVTWVFKKELYAKATNLKEIYTPAAGNDWVADDPSRNVDVTYGTFHGSMMAESLVGNILYHSHRTPLMVTRQKEHHWDRAAQSGITLLKDQTILIIGYGNIGRACAQLLIPFGCHVIGMKRSISSSIDEFGVECTTPEHMESALERADHVVLILPSGHATDGMFKQEYFTFMKKSAFIHNIGRGNAITTESLIWALENEVIAGAAIDVFEVEPLPKESPLWDLKNLFITPHSACVFENYKSEFFYELRDALSERLD
ncbi:MAG: D-2-hydroxyacid dehydrogenase [Fibrobacterales bacterium]